MKYLYRDVVYCCEEEVNEAICDFIGDRYNNIDPMATYEFEEEWDEVDILEDNED